MVRIGIARIGFDHAFIRRRGLFNAAMAMIFQTNTEQLAQLLRRWRARAAFGTSAPRPAFILTAFRPAHGFDSRQSASTQVPADQSCSLSLKYGVIRPAINLCQSIRVATEVASGGSVILAV